jgi:radical SAM superfamily enzyme YgiQ (UPF0313 family)
VGAKILLISGYELGHQPYHLAVAAAELIRGGHEVRCVDLAVEDAGCIDLEWPEAVALSVPMHTGAKIAVLFARRLVTQRPGVPIAFYGLYAHAAKEAFGRACTAIAGEYRGPLLDWAEDVALGKAQDRSAPRTISSLGRSPSVLPARHLLPPLERYAHLLWNGRRVPVGYIELTSGCSHRCRHCPVPIVYDGRLRKTAIETTVADVAQLVAAGAGHISIGDPDFLNAPRFALESLEAIRSSVPEVTFDVTAKVEHVVAYRDLWHRLGKLGVVFVVSAFETTNERILRILDKGHTPAEAAEAVRILRSAGIEPRPSWLPFTPWTRAKDLLDIFEFCSSFDVVANVDPVQFSLKLLVPPGSLLLDVPEMRRYLEDYDTDALSFRWRVEDPATIELQKTLADIAERAGEGAWSIRSTVSAMAAEVARVCALGESGMRQLLGRLQALTSDEVLRSRPRLSESWFCCAEPTAASLQAIPGENANIQSCSSCS